MQRRVALPALAVLAALSATAASGWTQRVATGGLAGVVLLDPATPVCRAGSPCTRPLRLTLVFSRRRRQAGRVTSDKSGRYRIVLPGGTYAVSTRPRSALGRLRPQQVRVPPGHFARIDFHYDAGIR